jgi:preprotein translocase subunit SecD
MAVDANVLIFERTREELRSGKTLYRSVESGFYRAFSSILDSNVTTLISCAALFYFGAGLVKGFALTLAIGVAISMFTALTCSRTLLFLP